MNFRTLLFSVSIVACACHMSRGQDPSDAGTSESKLSGSLSIFGNGDLLESSRNLRMAGESLERSSASLEMSVPQVAEAAEKTSQNLAAMSSGFDPLGLQNAFRTIQQQAEIIRQQQETIQKLQRMEILRLKKKNDELRGALNKLQIQTKKRSKSE